MGETTTVILLTLLAGAAIPLGGLLARVERIRPAWLEEELRHAVIAFGGGILLAAVALFAAGGILYRTFRDIAPQARLERRWAPALGAVLGFLLGLVGQMALS